MQQLQRQLFQLLYVDSSVVNMYNATGYWISLTSYLILANKGRGSRQENTLEGREISS
jgi:hypothetical protein